MNKIELLAPAGDLQRLKTAVRYGADAVYIGGRQFSLRSRASNFTLEDIREGNRYKKHDPARILRMNPRIDNEFKRILRDIKRILSDQDERY